MSSILNYDRERKELVELAVLDESADYEVDITEIHYNPTTKKFHLITASGCSCWSGEYEEEIFSSLLAIKKSLLKTERTYNPSFKGAEELIKEAKAKFKSLYKKDVSK